MKATGVVRKIDDLGRVVIPSEVRRTMDWNEKDGVEIFVDADKVILRKYAPGCMICNEADDLQMVAPNKLLCRSCMTKIVGLENQLINP